ncbi:MAG: Lrp/AsnC family transcriptional regulator [Anaerolineae bacterium]|nr:Lrp/AsnC family transcriptional regulator [Anaerolineae bacterium]
MTDDLKLQDLDDVDRRILELLQEQGRISNADLARHTGLSAPAIHARIRRLEEKGVIRAYVALLEREAVGFDMLCFINVSIQIHQPDAVAAFREAIQHMPQVLECYHVTGEYDYLLKVVIRNRKDLERFVVDQLTPVPGIAHIHTSLALAEVKATTALPLD